MGRSFIKLAVGIFALVVWTQGPAVAQQAAAPNAAAPPGQQGALATKIIGAWVTVSGICYDLEGRALRCQGRLVFKSLAADGDLVVEGAIKMRDSGQCDVKTAKISSGASFDLACDSSPDPLLVGSRHYLGSAILSPNGTLSGSMSDGDDMFRWAAVKQ